uniref:DUF772 domain-containing protein n=1 Tax=Steinernema glaseri TaxID=37863 RepID=A0A1I7YN18_9BILA
MEKNVKWTKIVLGWSFQYEDRSDESGGEAQDGLRKTMRISFLLLTYEVSRKTVSSHESTRRLKWFIFLVSQTRPNPFHNRFVSTLFQL